MTIAPSRGRSGAAMMAAFATTSVVNYAFSLVMAWLLLPGDFGVLAFAQTLLFVGGLILETGVPWSLAKELAVNRGRDQRAAFVRGAAAANVSLGLVMGVVLTLLFALGPLRSGLEDWIIAIALVLSLPLIGFVGVARGAAQGLELFPPLAGLQVTEIVGKALASTTLVVLGMGTFGAVAGFFIGAAGAAALGAGLLRMHLKMGPFGPVSRTRVGTAAPMLGAFLGSALLLNLDFLALKTLAGQERATAGFYQAGIVLANAPYFLVSSVVIPMVFANLARRGGLAHTADVIGRALRLAAVVILPIELVLIVAPDFALGLLFPEAYLAGADALRFRALGVSLFIVMTVIAASYQALGNASRVAKIFLGGAALESLVLAYASRWGGTGVAIGFAVTIFVVTAVLAGDYLRHLESRHRARALGWFGRYALVLGVSIPAFFVVAGFSANVLLSLGAACVLFALLAWALGLVPVRDVRSVAGNDSPSIVGS